MTISGNRKEILDSFLANIACISDEDYQERVWVRGEGPECDDIDDTLCDFFDECHILENYKYYGISEDQLKLLIALRNKLRKFSDKFRIYSQEISTAELLEFTEWQEIIGISKSAIRLFNYQKK